MNAHVAFPMFLEVQINRQNIIPFYLTYFCYSEYRRLFDRVVALTHLNLRRLELGSETWGAQFREAMSVNGGDVANATTRDYVMHFCTFAWKVG